MSSGSLIALHRGLLEVAELQRADQTPVGEAPENPEVARAIGRASVVLLSSHFERYIYALNEEATEFLNGHEILGRDLPELLRLLHSQEVVDELFSTQWDRRADRLLEFVEEEAWLWSIEGRGYLQHKRLLAWMKAPSPANLLRYFKYWGIDDIFSAVTRAPHTRSELWLRIDELVGKRNNIAHGDLTTEATRIDLVEYEQAVGTFSDRVDRLLGGIVGKLIEKKTAW